MEKQAKRSQDGTYHYLDRRHPANAGRNQTNEYLGLEEKNMLERYTRPEMGISGRKRTNTVRGSKSRF